MASKNGQSCSSRYTLFKLPTELRHEIYNYLMPEQCLVIYYRPKSHRAGDRTISAISDNDLSALLTCSFAEVQLDILYWLIKHKKMVHILITGNGKYSGHRHGPRVFWQFRGLVDKEFVGACFSQPGRYRDQLPFELRTTFHSNSLQISVMEIPEEEAMLIAESILTLFPKIKTFFLGVIFSTMVNLTQEEFAEQATNWVSAFILKLNTYAGAWCASGDFTEDIRRIRILTGADISFRQVSPELASKYGVRLK
ncbi:MAG: hypothetical protein M1820_005936 [Bogoriella megaspora]|nr:MAG: hypothetical protein M1820_005936 [Bogoriella megaspora]